MIDETTPKGRIAAAALALAAERPWRDVTLRDIGDRSGLGLAGLREHVHAKGDVIAVIAQLVDNQVLENLPPLEPGDAKRDRLFEVLMARLDVLAPHKAAIRSIVADASTEPAA
ncbi:MAG: TetR/AcrR family transcriptional regulator, partial [Hyphomicrobiaceae bacterium]